MVPGGREQEPAKSELKAEGLTSWLSCACGARVKPQKRKRNEGLTPREPNLREIILCEKAEVTSCLGCCLRWGDPQRLEAQRVLRARVRNAGAVKPLPC